MRASDWDERYLDADRLWSVGPNVFVEDRLAAREPGSGLDLACGEGRNTVWLAERGWSMVGVDFSTVAIERARSRSSNAEFVIADVLTWEAERSFDLVLVAYLHLDESDFRSVVARAASWLSAGGELFLIGHDRSNIEHGHGGPQMPEILWDVDTILGWLDDLEIIEAQVVRRPVEVEDRVLLARDTLVRARALRDRTGLS